MAKRKPQTTGPMRRVRFAAGSDRMRLMSLHLNRRAQAHFDVALITVDFLLI